jgi:hypothetical protein
MKLLTRIAAVAAGTAVLTLASGLGSAAWADTVTRQRSVLVFWIQQGAIPGVQGNVHIGGLQASAAPGEHTANFVYSEILDYTCPEGYLPTGVSIEAQTQLDQNCVYEDDLVVETGDLALTIDGKLHSARMDGTINYIHTVQTGPAGSIPVDLRWSAPGDKTVTSDVVVLHNPRTVFITTTREASVVGTIGTEHIGSGTQISTGQTMRTTLRAKD